MRADKAFNSIWRVVVMLHPGQLSQGQAVALATTDFDRSDAQLDEWKNGFVKSGGICLYDGPPKDSKEKKLEWPPLEITRESDTGPFCKHCGSSLRRTRFLPPRWECIQPECKSHKKEVHNG